MTIIMSGTLLSTNGDALQAQTLVIQMTTARKRWEDDGRPNSGDRA